MKAETTCCVAASYEAKAFGVKTGTAVWEAQQLRPGIRIVEAQPIEYVRCHHAVARKQRLNSAWNRWYKDLANPVCDVTYKCW